MVSTKMSPTQKRPSLNIRVEIAMYSSATFYPLHPALFFIVIFTLPEVLYIYLFDVYFFSPLMCVPIVSVAYISVLMS